MVSNKNFVSFLVDQFHDPGIKFENDFIEQFSKSGNLSVDIFVDDIQAEFFDTMVFGYW